MSYTPDLVSSDVDVKVLDSILIPYYSWTSSFYLKVYAKSPESGVMRAPEDVDVLCVTGGAFKRKKYYLSDEYRTSDDDSYEGWYMFYCTFLGS